MVKKEQYTIEPIDVDGDGIPDGDLVSKYVNGKLISRKFVPLTKLKKIADNSSSKTNVQNNSSKKSKVIYKNLPNVQDTDKPVLVQDTTGIAQYIKQGAATQAGRLATDAVVDGIKGLFAGDEE